MQASSEITTEKKPHSEDASVTAPAPAAAKKKLVAEAVRVPASRVAAVMALFALSMMILCEVAARALTAPPRERTPNVMRLPSDPLGFRDAPVGPQVLVMGSSQLYMEPGTKPGEQLRTDASLTTVDYIARDVGKASYYVYGFPRLLPFEMIVTTKHLLDSGFKPTLAILSVTWPTVAHDHGMRTIFSDVLRSPGFSAALRAELVANGAQPETLGIVDTETARTTKETEREDLASHASGVDRRLMRFARDHSALFGRSTELRERIAKSVVEPVVIGLAKAPPLTSDPVEETNLLANVAATRDLVLMLRKHGVRVFVYRAPERSDLVPITAAERRDEVLGKLAEDLATLDVTMVDGGNAVPTEYWGWNAQYADRSHFVSEGHAVLARFVVGEAKARSFFEPLEREAK